VVIYQENHSFDNVLGRYCIQNSRCNGAMSGTASNGLTISLSTATDVVPSVDHGVNSQINAIHGGRMDRFDQLGGCASTTTPPYACYSQFNPTQIPNLASLATRYALSDMTFEENPAPSFGAHIELVAGTLDGFSGENPGTAPDHAAGPGWGCDSFKLALWRPSTTQTYTKVPACIPMQDGSGPYVPSPVPWVPTIMDRLDSAELTWRIYATKNAPTAPTSANLPYGWAICPTFADCLYTTQANNMVDSSQILTDAHNGTLPNLALVMPNLSNSQHNSYSMAKGDNWIGAIISAIQQGGQWGSTAVFITYDDCGCFYDHVPPPPGLGIRVPMILVSPYSKAGYTDSATASFSSMLAYTEHAFNLAPLATDDANAYDYAHSFDYTQQPLAPSFTVRHTIIPRAEQQYIRNHPPPPDDPT
jgi:phospholipase C